ncbi:MAG: hypothetical protein U0229_24235 [Anaeromyxobacter sp.]
MFRKTLLAALAAVPLLSLPAVAAAAPGDEVEVTAGVVTGLKCALDAKEKNDLKLLTACPPAEATKGLVVFDVAEKRIYGISTKAVRRFELEAAFGGGSIDFTGKEVKSDPKTEVTTVDVSEYSIARRPKPGHFKGCL